jgi:hypothetical protein
MSGHGFDWFSGAATIAAPCPAGLAGTDGLRPFFAAPNDPAWGDVIPRTLYHETLHLWQLAASTHLRDMVAEEWGRVAALERDGTAPPPGPLRHGFGRPADGTPFSVRDLVECLARFWDVHTRGATRLLAEEGTDLGETGEAIAAARAAQGHAFYSGIEFDALMRGGRDRALYAGPYLALHDHCLASSGLRALAGDRAVEPLAGWAANLILPLAGFVALNTAQPVAAFDLAVRRMLSPDAIGVAHQRRNAWEVINLDWLQFWGVLIPGLGRSLAREGLAPRHRDSVAHPGLAAHPVWCHLPDRLTALQKSLRADALCGGAAEPDAHPAVAESRRLEPGVTRDDPWCVFGLPGHPNFRMHLGVAFAPPLLRFADAEIPATASAAFFAHWSMTAEALAAAVRDAEARHAALRAADAARRLGLPPGAFAAPLAGAAPLTQ